MNTFQLSCFLAVANCLNFARAAEQMNVSQPAITHQIQTLEGELNVKLFRRSTRMVEITPEGRSFVSDAKSMVAIAEQAKLRFRDPGDQAFEVLSIGCSGYTQLDLLAETLHDLSACYPNLHPRLTVAPPDQLFHLLDTETVNVVFGIGAGAEGKGRLTFKELLRSSLVCVCREDHPAAGRESVSVRELAEEKLIFCDPINLAPDIAKLQWELAEGKHPADIHFCGSPEASLVLADAGFGVAILPELLAPDRSSRVKVKLEEAPGLPFGLFYKPYPGDAILKEFIQSAKRHLTNPTLTQKNKIV